MKQKFSLGLLLALFHTSFILYASDASTAAEKYSKDLLALYHDLHREPELSFFEEKTSARLADLLEGLGFEVTRNIANTYAIAGIMKNSEGPVVLIRTDMDGLPVKEETNLPYASIFTQDDEQGVPQHTMHACGHDIHMSSWIGTARFLAEHKHLWKGTVIMFGQPAEERGGARFLFRKQLFGGILPMPDYCIALHASASLPAGTVGHVAGPALASTDMIDITVYGKGGHGAYPHLTIDPIVLASRMVVDFQTIVSREIAPTEPAVVTVGSFHGGSKHNIIPSVVKMELTVRAYSDEVRNQILAALERISKGVAISAGLGPDQYPVIHVREEGVPATVNESALTERIFAVHQKVLGAEQTKMVEPVMGGEDFAYYGRTKEQVPICMFWLGTIAPDAWLAAERGEIPKFSLHSPFYAPDAEKSIITGVRAMSAAALDLLAKP